LEKTVNSGQLVIEQIFVARDQLVSKVGILIEDDIERR
jgi:hypothetical protein